MAVPRLGVYVGKALNVTCQGDNITYEVVLLDRQRSTVQMIPQLSYFKGGQPPWQVEGTWESEDGEVVIGVTKQDITGPRKDTDLKLTIGADGALIFRDTPCTWKSPPPEADPLKAKQEEIARSSAEAQAKQAELEAKREELQRQHEEQEAARRAQEEELRRLREELEQQRQRQAAEAAKAEEERARLAAEAEEQRVLRERQQQELNALMRAKEEVQSTREALAAQQSLVEAKRLEVENSRAASEEERAAKLAEVQTQQAELQRLQQEVERQRIEEERLRQAQDETFKLMDQELKERADHLVQAEQGLSQERQQIMKSRRSLGMVQAHVVSMLDEADKHLGLANGQAHISLDASDEPEAELDAEEEDMRSPGGADVWNMDWSSVAGKQQEVPPAEGPASVA
uniref:Uncharacterized protein n=1 Tax=Pyrodinium bahamense TaxID=73915 RepID=A0A7S0B6P8_9DINO